MIVMFPIDEWMEAWFDTNSGTGLGQTSEFKVPTKPVPYCRNRICTKKNTRGMENIIGKI